LNSELFTAITEDGSLSLVSGQYMQLYHNRIGAYTEALLNYSNVAMAVLHAVHGAKLTGTINILDCCFGLGYNSLVFAQELPADVDLNVTAIELDPGVIGFVPQVLNQACFAPLRAAGLGKDAAAAMGAFERTVVHSKGKNSTYVFDMEQSCLRDYWRQHGDKHRGDQHLILHDPFSPKKMPELWTIDLFERYKSALTDGGMVLTYSSAPAVRGAFLELGFRVYRTPFLGGKWGGTLAVLGDYMEEAVTKGELAEHITPLGALEYERLVKSSRVPFRDPGLNSERDDILSARLVEQEVFFAAVRAQRLANGERVGPAGKRRKRKEAKLALAQNQALSVDGGSGGECGK
jgi:tRNA U34 5-methylaminomethyl-2-thiouridine-forming methyltransferase MnmC